MDDLPDLPTYSPEAVMWVVMEHLADVGIKREFVPPDADPVGAVEAAASLLRALGVIPLPRAGGTA